jgi:hypothetical protein
MTAGGNPEQVDVCVYSGYVGIGQLIMMLIK